MKVRTILSITVLFFLMGCGSTCDRIFKSLEHDQVYDYIGFENSSYWTLSNGNSSIEVKKKTYDASLSSGCDQVNIKTDWTVMTDTQDKFVIHQSISHNKKIKYSFATVKQINGKDSIPLTTVHYNKSLNIPQNDSTFYFVQKYKGYKNVLCYQFKNAEVETIYIAPQIGPIEVQIKNKETYTLQNPNTVMAEVEDFQ